MKAAFKKLGTLNKVTIIRTFFLSIVFMALFVATLYMLINSPA